MADYAYDYEVPEPAHNLVCYCPPNFLDAIPVSKILQGPRTPTGQNPHQTLKPNKTLSLLRAKKTEISKGGGFRCVLRPAFVLCKGHGEVQ
jgi:hypothetical protein